MQAETSEFEHWKREQATEFQNFQTAEDKAFVEFLRKEWEEFQVFQGNVRDATPKPPTPPAVRNAAMSGPSNRPSPVVRTPPRGTPPPHQAGKFYGYPIQPVEFPVTRIDMPRTLSSQAIAASWNQVSMQNHAPLLQSIKRYQSEMNLGDWGLIRLIDQLLQTQFPEQNARTFYLWFLLSHLGYDVKAGYTRDALVLMIPAINKLYGMRYSVIDDRAYYMMPQPSDDRVFSYEGDYRPQQNPFDFSLSRLIKPTRYDDNLTIHYRYKGHELAFQLQYDAGLSEFLADYPQIDLPLYFRAPPASPAVETLRNQLRPLIKDMPPREAIDFLLGLTQHLFQYATDNVQFGREKYLAVEESLFYGTNDCEDRSIFLAWLIHDILGLEQVVLDYPGHIALAVKTDVLPDDDLVEHQGHKYVVVDPTYIDAKSGMAMPALANTTPATFEIHYASTL